jgi:hypothetical protein
VDPGGHPGVAAQHVRLAQCCPQVVAGGDALLGSGCVVGPSGFLDHLAFGDLGQQPADDPIRRESRQREEYCGGPPGEARDHPQRARGEEGAHGLPHAPAHQLPDLPGVVVDAVEHLAHGLLGQLGERLGHRGVEQVGTQLALSPVAHRRPDRLGDGVDDGTADDAQRQQHDQRRGGVLGEPPGDHRPEGCRDRTQQGHRQTHDRERTTDPAPVDRDTIRRNPRTPECPVLPRALRLVVPQLGHRHNHQTLPITTDSAPPVFLPAFEDTRRVRQSGVPHRPTARVTDDQPKQVSTDLIAAAINVQPNNLNGSPSDTTDPDLTKGSKQSSTGLDLWPERGGTA